MYLWGQNYHRTFQVYFFQFNSLLILKDSTFKVIIWQEGASALHYTKIIFQSIVSTVTEYIHII